MSEHCDEKCENTVTYPKGIKWTRQRKAVYDILNSSEEPMSANQIYHLLERNNDSAEYAISTVYRILAVFEEQGIILKSTFLNEETSVYELDKGLHTHYAVCMKCHRRVLLEGCPFMKMHLPKMQDDFQITGHKLELYGYCKECQSK